MVHTQLLLSRTHITHRGGRASGHQHHRRPSYQVKILKSQIATISTIQHDFMADFRDVLPLTSTSLEPSHWVTFLKSQLAAKSTI